MFLQINKGDVYINMSKIISIMSVMPGCGAKYIATNISHYHKQIDDESKIAIIDFDFENPFLAETLDLNDDVHRVDNLIEIIDGSILNNETFLINMIHLKNNVDLLKGTRLIGHQKIYNQNHIETILKFLRENYDYIYIVINPNTKNAGTIYTLFDTDEIVLVSRNNYSCLKKIDDVVKIIKQFLKNDCKLNLLYNQYYEASKIDFIDVIGMNSLNVIGAVNYDEETIDNLDIKINDMDIVQKISSKFKKEEPQKDLYKDILDKILE